MSFRAPIRIMSFGPALITSHILQLLRHHPMEHWIIRIFVTSRPRILHIIFDDHFASALGIHLIAVQRFVAVLTTEVTNNNDWLLLIFHILIGWNGELETRMHVLAFGAVAAVTGHVVRAEYPTHVPVAAVRPMPTEAPVVPWTIFYFAFGIDV